MSKNSITLSFAAIRISGRDLGSTIADLQQALRKPGLLPSGMYDRLGGLYQQQQIAFHGLMIVLLAAVALVFLLLLFVFEASSRQGASWRCHCCHCLRCSSACG